MTALSVVVPTVGSLASLRLVLDSLEHQTCPRSEYEILVVDDGSTDGTEQWCAGWRDGRRRRYVRQDRCGTPLARNLGVLMAWSPLVLFLDDDEQADGQLLDEHRRAHRVFADPPTAVVGSSSWRTGQAPTALMHYLSHAEPLPFAYPSNPRQLAPSVISFRSRHLSFKRAFLAQRGLHDGRFGLLADVELGCRLVVHGLRLRYWSHARSERLSTFAFDGWCEQMRREGWAVAALAAAHDHPEVRAAARVDAACSEWQAAHASYEASRQRTRLLETELGAAYAEHCADALVPLWRAYWYSFGASRVRGVAEGAAQRNG